MKLTDDELTEDYKKGMEALTDFLAKREEYRETIKKARVLGKRVPAEVHADTLSKLHEFDRIIDGLETSLAKEYERILAEKAKEAEITAKVNDGYQAVKEIYIHVKHETPHLLDSFTERVLDPMTPEDREQFLDEVAILEATKLQAILNGTA